MQVGSEKVRHLTGFCQVNHYARKMFESGLNDHNYQWSFHTFNLKHSFSSLTSYNLKFSGFSLVFDRLLFRISLSAFIGWMLVSAFLLSKVWSYDCIYLEFKFVSLEMQTFKMRFEAVKYLYVRAKHES